MDECAYEVRKTYEADVDDGKVRALGFGPALFRLARHQVDAGEAARARRSFAEALRHWRGLGGSEGVRAAAWIVVLSFPARMRSALGTGLVKASRAVDRLLGIRQPLRSLALDPSQPDGS